MTALYENDRNVGYAIILRDISEHNRAEEALRTSEERLRQLIEGVKDYVIYMLDATGTVVTWNDSAAHIYGYAAAEIIGQHRKVFFRPEDVAEGVLQHELHVAATEGHVSEEGWRVREDGSLLGPIGQSPPSTITPGACESLSRWFGT